MKCQPVAVCYIVLAMKRVSAVLLLAVLVACATPPPSGSLLVATAASMAPAVELLAEEFTEQTDVPVILSVGSSGNLAAQIANGSPVDLFLSANSEYVDTLISQGSLAADTRLEFAQGVLVLASAQEVNPPPGGLEELTQSRYQNLTFANPAHAPYGRAARQALVQAGIWEHVQDRIVMAETVGQAGIFVSTGNASAGLLAQSVAIQLGLTYIPVPTDLYQPIHHVGAVTSDTMQAELALEFLLMLSGERGQNVLGRFGFSAGPGGN